MTSDAVLGIDFGGPRRARDQRRKIIAIEARPAGWRRYRVDADGLNARLLGTEAPGWTAGELLDELLGRPVRVAAFDFPFSLPNALLREDRFASEVGWRHGPFRGWRAFNDFVAARLPLTDPLDFRPFDPWRARTERKRLWVKRRTDVIAGGQPPLKDKFQAMFQMTLLGSALLAQLWESARYRVLPFAGGRGPGEVIEVFPGATLRQLGLASYKSQPQEAVRLAIGACTAAGIRLDVDRHLLAACCRYSSGASKPDYDAADAFVALSTAVLHAEGATRMAVDGPPHLKGIEGAIWVPSIGWESGGKTLDHG